jgi:RecB family exonuclease
MSQRPAFLGKTLHLFATSAQARWHWRAQMALTLPVQVGGEFQGLSALVASVGEALWGPPQGEAQQLASLDALLSTAAHRAFVGPQGFGKSPVLLRKILLDQMALLHAAGALELGEPSLAALHPRDRPLIALLRDWVEVLGEPGPGRWYRGQVAAMVRAGAADLPMLRDLTEVVIYPDADWPPWTTRWLEALCPRRVRAVSPSVNIEKPEAQPHNSPVWHACDSPQAEILAAVRLMSGSPAPTALLVPAAEVGAWTAQLQAFGLPTLAFEQGVARETQVERLLTTMARLSQGEAVARRDLQTLLTTPLLQWQADTAEAARIPRGQLVGLWRLQRRSTGTLAQWQTRLTAAQELAIRQLRDRRPGLEEAVRDDKSKQIAAATKVIQDMLEKIEGLSSAADVVALLEKWELLRRSAVVGGEAQAARACVAGLKAFPASSFTKALGDVLAGLSRAERGDWLDQSSADQPTCWVVPWEAVPEQLPPRRILCGLDKFPPAAKDDAWLSPGLVAALGLPSPAQRVAYAESVVERVLAGAETAVLSHRTRGGTGASVAPPAWLARRLAKIKGDLEAKSPDCEQVLAWSRASVLAGAAALPAGYAWAPRESLPAETLAAAALSRRKDAIASHGGVEAGPWTGELGVRPVAPASGYSVTSLQRYACNPYRYFLQTVLGLREEDEADDALDSREQGVALHAALEKPLRAELAGGGVDWARVTEVLCGQAAGAIEEQYGLQAAELLAEPVWRGEASRWQAELAVWLAGQDEHRAAAPGGDLTQARVACLSKDDGAAVKQAALAAAMLVQPDRAEAIAADGGFSPRTGFGKFAKNLASQELDKALGGRNSLQQLVDDAQPLLAKADARLAQHLAQSPMDRLLAVERPLQLANGAPRPLDVGQGHYLAMQGSIDRVEGNAAGDRLAVVDYKTGKPDQNLCEKIATGEHLQLPLYALALETMAQQGELAELGVRRGAEVRAIRLEYLRRYGKKKTVTTVALDPREPIAVPTPTSVDKGRGPDAQAVEPLALSALAMAQGYAQRFKTAIEDGHLALVQRTGKDYGDRFTQAMRLVPAAPEEGGAAPWLTRLLGDVPSTTPGAV